MRIIAFDQASRTTGYSIFEDGKLIKCDSFTLSASDLGERLVKFRQKMQSLIDEFKPDFLIFEDVYQDEKDKPEANKKTFKILSEVLGVCEELASECGIPYEVVMAVTWKSNVGIDIKQTRPMQKKASQDYVLKTYGLNVIDDISDAVCIGDYYFNKDRKIQKITRSKVTKMAGFDWSV